MKKLYKYKGYDSNSNTILHGWDSSKQPYVFQEESDPDYVDIHTIAGVFGNADTILNFNQKRLVLSSLFYAKAGYSLENYNTLSDNEKFIGAKLFFIPYSLRVSSIFSDYQDLLNWNELVVKTQGTPVEQYEGRALVAEKMRQLVGSSYVRKDLMTYSNSKTFGRDAHLMVEHFTKYSDAKFYFWLTNAVGTEFENDGFIQKTYTATNELMTQLKNDLVSIYTFG